MFVGLLSVSAGKYAAPPDWKEIITAYRGSELQLFFKRIIEDTLKAVVKPQYVDQVPKQVNACMHTPLRQSVGRRD